MNFNQMKILNYMKVYYIPDIRTNLKLIIKFNLKIKNKIWIHIQIKLKNEKKIGILIYIRIKVYLQNQ